jgi:aminoglycoside phosphotransferase family enzyme
VLSLEDKVAFLQRPDSYPDCPQQVDTIETHMSWVFLTERHAYKLKKPVHYDFLDFSTIAARHADCAAELSLNRRLAPDVYLGLVPLTLDAEGKLRLEGPGEAVDWLVQMRRLPPERMLDSLLQAGTVSETDIRRLAARLASFYRASPPLGMGATEYRERLAHSVLDTWMALAEPAFGLAQTQVDAIHEAQLSFLTHHSALLEERAARVVEGHGDLRPEHVCLEDAPVVIDCLEFEREFRLVDPADELAFLALECERLGAHQVGEAILAAYAVAAGDAPPTQLLDFYKSYRACLRAKLAVWHTRDHEVPDHDKWLKRARAYLRLAEVHIGRAQQASA